MERGVFAVIGFLIGFILAAALFTQHTLPQITANVISAPTGNIQDDNITVYPARVVIKVANATISNYGATGSMTPLLDGNAHGIRIKPESADQISVGDLVTFNASGTMVIHRVVEKGNDSQGIYFITKGDSNPVNDKPIHFSDIYYKTIGILY